MLTDLRLRDFRLFRALAFAPGEGVSFVVGPNAQGKTSLLEAVCLLLRLQSPRTATPCECVRFGAASFGVDGHYGGRHLRVEFEGRLKRFSLDSKLQAATSDYLEVGRVAWFSNADLDLVQGGGAGRRRFLDFLGVQLVDGYRHHLRAYERALRSRNALLREARPVREVVAFDGPLRASGDVLLAARAHLVARIGPLLAAAHDAIAGAPHEALTVAYEPGAVADMAAALETSRTEDLRTRSTSVGPHRDDLAIRLDGRPVASFASEGQQRTISLALKLAQARRIAADSGRQPLHLIDDVFGELDATRRNNLLAALPATAQTIITATSLHWIERPAGTVFRFEDGRLRAY